MRIDAESYGLLAVCAIRYCQGRRSYMPSIVQDIVREHIMELEDRDLKVMIQDCNSMTDFDFGSEYIDKPGWIKFRAELEAEWERRGNADID